MSNQNPNPNPSPNYPQIPNPNYHPTLPPSSSPSPSPSPSLYPTLDLHDLTHNLFPHNYHSAPPYPQYPPPPQQNPYYPPPPQQTPYYPPSAPTYYQYSPSTPETSQYPPSASQTSECSPSAPILSVEETLLVIPGAILHLIDKEYSVELATGDLVVNVLRNGDDTVAVIVSVADEVQWPLTKDVAAVKLDDSHYFFSFTTPDEINSKSIDDEIGIKPKKKDKKSKKSEKEKKTEKLENEMLSYGLTFVSKGQEELVRKLEGVLESYSAFSVQKVARKAEAEVLDGAVAVAREMSPMDLRSKTKKGVAEDRCAAYWTTLAPNVEEYSGTAARYIASGSGQLVKGILWCGDVTSDRLKWGDEVLRKRMMPGEKAEVSPETLKRIRRVKRVSKMTQSVASVVLSGALKVSGYFASSLVNSKMGKKFFGHLPGEVLLASLDGFSKICDAAEVAGKNVMSTSSTVTTGLVHHKYGEEAAKATNEGLDAAGHAVGTAWTVFKLRQALNPKSVLKPTTFAKVAAAAAAEKKAAEKKMKQSK